MLAQSLKTFEVEVLETNEFDIDSTAGNNIASEDDQTTAIDPTAARTLSEAIVFESVRRLCFRFFASFC